MTRICKILVVEDNDGIRDFLHALFDDEGYHITIVVGGEQMRAALAEDRFDVALIDVTLPGADDGFTLAKVARTTGCGVILVTGNARHFRFGEGERTSLSAEALSGGAAARAGRRVDCRNQGLRA